MMLNFKISARSNMNTNISTLVAVVLMCSANSRAQGGGPVITSPSDGTVVAAGSSISVSVSVPNGTSFSSVGVAVNDPGFGPVQVLTSPPFQFTLRLQDGSIGLRQITAFGVTGTGQAVFSPPVTIDAEPAAGTISLVVSPTGINFSFVGQQIPILINGNLADGTSGPLTESSHTVYTSNSSGVAVVDRHGVVTAAGTGKTTILISNGSLQAAVSVTVPVAVRGDLNGDGKVNQDDLNVILSALNIPASKPADARDLNGDGVIDILDAQILVSLCNTVCQLPGSKASPIITWPRPADIIFGTALGSAQLNAAANVPGTFVYLPPGGTVLPVGNGQALAVSFIPKDATNYSTGSAQTSVNVQPGSGSSAKIVVTSVLNRDTSNNILVKLTLADSSGVAAASVALTSVKIGTFSGTPLPQAVGTIGANSLVQTAVTVPGSTGAPGAASSLTITGTYTGGTFSAISRITLP